MSRGGGAGSRERRYPGTPVTDLGSERQAATLGRAHQHWLLPARKQQDFLLLASLWSLVIALGHLVDTVLISKAAPGRFCCLRPWTREEEEQTLLWEGEKHLTLTGKKSYLHSLPFFFFKSHRIFSNSAWVQTAVCCNSEYYEVTVYLVKEAGFAPQEEGKEKFVTFTVEPDHTPHGPAWTSVRYSGLCSVSLTGCCYGILSP